MYRITFFSLVVWLFTACASEPRPIDFGKDSCHHCKMTLMDPLFGAEVVTQTGKVYVFDDVNCLVDFLNEDEMVNRPPKHILVVNHNGSGELIDATMAYYVLSDEIRSPMASQIAAFGNEADMKEFKEKYKGIFLGWAEVLVQFK